MTSFSVGGISPKVSNVPQTWKYPSPTRNGKSIAEKTRALRQGPPAASSKSDDGNGKKLERSLHWNMRKLRLPSLRAQWRKALTSFVVTAFVWMQGIPRVAHAVTVNTRFAPGSSPLLIPVTFASPPPPASTASKGIITVLTNGKVLTAILVIMVVVIVAAVQKQD